MEINKDMDWSGWLVRPKPEWLNPGEDAKPYVQNGVFLLLAQKTRYCAIQYIVFYYIEQPLYLVLFLSC